MNTLLQKTIPFLIIFLISLIISYIIDRKITYTQKINSKLSFNEGYLPYFYVSCGLILIAAVAIIRNSFCGFSISLLYAITGFITALLTNSLMHCN